MPLGVIRRALSTFGLFAIWTLELVNYLVHVALRPVPWNSTSTAIGYALWAIQLASLFVFQATDPGTASASWEAAATEGKVSSMVCKRTGKLLPPRAMYVRRAKGVVLGLDHYCGWTGTPVGLRNRKLFVLFVIYSSIFCAMGFGHSLYAALCSLPDALMPKVVGSGEQCWHLEVPAALVDAIDSRRLGLVAWQSLVACHEAFAFLLHLLERAHAHGQFVYALLLFGTVPANLLATVFLGTLAAEQLRLISRNRTTLEPDDARYDIGLKLNWRQWFGDAMLLWPLPLPPHVGDGYAWPLNPAARIGSQDDIKPTRQRVATKRRSVVLDAKLREALGSHMPGATA